MGMPQIPKGTNRPTLEETVIDLLESIALEEMAIAHILNAQGEKLQQIIEQYSLDKICYDDLETSFLDTNKIVNSLIMKEWLLVNKMNSVIDFSSKTLCCDIEWEKGSGCKINCEDNCKEECDNNCN